MYTKPSVRKNFVWKTLFLCCLRIANVQYKCIHVRRTCVTTPWVAGQNPRHADFYFLLLPNSPCFVGMLFLCCLRIANVQYKCIHASRTCVTTPWVAGQSPRRADFYFLLLPNSTCIVGMLFLCCLRIANVQYKCIHVRRTCVTTPWVAGQNPRRAEFYFFLLSSSPCNVGVLFLCCLRIANVQYKCIHVRRTCVTTPWVAGQNPRRADFYFLLLPNSPCIVGMLFLCCLRIANVQYKCIHVHRTCVTTPWVAGQNPRRADFYFLLLPSSPCIVGMLFLCCLRIANVQYKCIHVRRTCVTTPWVAGQNPRRADFYFLLLSSSPCNVGVLFLCCLRIANVQYKCIHVRRTCVTTPWVAGQNPRRADFYFLLLSSSPCNVGVLFLCCLRIANVQYKCIHVRRTRVTTPWVAGQNPRRAEFYFLLLSSSPCIVGMLFLCCLRIANVQYKCKHVRRTCVTTPWVAGQNPRRADFYFLLLSNSLCIVGMLFLCCLRIANVQYKCIHVRRTCVTTPWVAGQNPRRADFYFLLLSSSPCIVGMLFLCCLRIANVQYKCIHVRRTCVTTPWVAGQNPRRADFYFFLLPSSPCIVGMLFLCCLRIANVQYKCIHVRRTCVMTPWVAGQNPRRADFYFLLLSSSPCIVGMLFAHCQCTIQVHTRT